VHLAVGSGEDLAGYPTGAYDLVLSLMVFQHIADADVLVGYLEEVARVLAPGGAALLHFETRPQRGWRRALMALPDALLPRDRRRFIRRVRRDPDWVRSEAARAGLRVESERGSATAEHLFLLRRAADGGPQAFV
jgi:SAM-dependent methyltransferase